MQLAVYKADFEQERQDRIQAHSMMAEMEKESTKYEGQMELDDYEELKHNYQIVNNQLAKHQESLSMVEQVNDTLRQEIQAKSSQVKQYAKEVDRLKRKVRNTVEPLSNRHISGSLSFVEKCGLWEVESVIYCRDI